MNNKGFTLVELLATIIILSIVMGIATSGVISYINTSKKRSEKIFVDKLENSIDAYLNLNGRTLETLDSIPSADFQKCKDATCGDSYIATAHQLKSIHLQDLVTANLVELDKVINPKNKKNCLNNANPEVVIFKDSDYVYYYYVDLSGNKTSCEISDENSLISTLPKKLIKKLKEQGRTDLPSKLVENV